MHSEFWDSILVAKRLYGKLMDSAAEKYGLTRMELDILLFLVNNPDFDTATDIITRRGLTKSHVSASVKSLSDKGLLERNFHGGNLKTIHLTVQDAAADIIAEGRKKQKEFGKAVFWGMGEEELQEFQNTLCKISENMHHALEERSS